LTRSDGSADVAEGNVLPQRSGREHTFIGEDGRWAAMAADRRLVGIALLSVVLASLMSVRAVAGWEIPGRSVAAPLPLAPQSGTCLAPAGIAQLVQPVESVALGTCSGPHSAEIFFWAR